jgi:NitT/TauT family transport system substrate-binding protein
MSYIPNIQFAPFYLAETDGLFDQATAKVELRHHGASEGLFTAIASGQEQFVIAGGDEALQAREQGVDLVAVGSYYRHYPVRIIAPTAKQITTLADLRGKRIGVPGRYGESWFGLLVALRSAGLTEDDVTVMEIGYTANAALATDKVDAVVGFSNNDLVQFQLAQMDVTALGLAPDGAPPLVGASIITTAEFLAANPELVKQVVTAIGQGMEAALADPARAVKVAEAYIPGLAEANASAAARATLDATLLVMANDGCGYDPDPCPPEGCRITCDDQVPISVQIDSQAWAQMADFLLQVGVLSKPADVAQATADVFG